MSTSTRIFPESKFAFIWDSLEDRVMIPNTSSTEPGESTTADWIYIFDIMEEPFEHFLFLYNACLQLFQPLPEIYPAFAAQKNADSGPKTPNGLECTICDSMMTLQFQECTHGACGSCVSSLYRSRIKRQYFPRWFTCPFCRAEVHHVGTLSPGSEIETPNGTVPKWITVQRWVAVHSGNGSDIAKGLKEFAMSGRRYYMLSFIQVSWGEITGNIRLVTKSEVLKMRATAAADRLETWDLWVRQGFALIGENIRTSVEGRRPIFEFIGENLPTSVEGRRPIFEFIGENLRTSVEGRRPIFEFIHIP